MSIGIGAVAKLISQGNNCVIYQYGGYNLNEEEYMNAKRIYDGKIIIQICCFQEPEIHEKVKKMPGGKKKLITKRIPVSVDYAQMIDEGLIKIENCSNCWKVTDDGKGHDVMALHLLYKIFQNYQVEGKIPALISYNV